jgi:hypothetical protein
MNLLLVTRAAQSAFNKAGYSRDDAYQNALAIASYLSEPENYEACRKLYQINDDSELAYRLAQTLVEDLRSKQGL